MITVMNIYLHLSSMSAKFLYSKYMYSRSKLLLFSLSPSAYLLPYPSLSLSHAAFLDESIFCLKLSLFHFHTSVISSKVMVCFNYGDRIVHLIFLHICVFFVFVSLEMFDCTLKNVWSKLIKAKIKRGMIFILFFFSCAISECCFRGFLIQGGTLLQ